MGYARMMPYLYGMFLSNVPLQSQESRVNEENRDKPNKQAEVTPQAPWHEEFCTTL